MSDVNILGKAEEYKGNTVNLESNEALAENKGVQSGFGGGMIIYPYTNQIIVPEGYSVYSMTTNGTHNFRTYTINAPQNYNIIDYITSTPDPFPNSVYGEYAWDNEDFKSMDLASSTQILYNAEPSLYWA